MKLSDLKRAVNSIVVNTVDNVPIVDADLSAPIVRPSTKTFLNSGSAGRINADCNSRTVTVDIYFFAADRGSPRMENMDVQDKLAYAFLDGIKVDADILISVLDDIVFQTEDGVLHVSFSVDVFEQIDRDTDAEIMDNLHASLALQLEEEDSDGNSHA